MTAADELEPRWRIPAGRGRDQGIGIVGAGGIVRIGHLPAYRAAGLRVVAVTDADPARARALARDFDIPHVAASVAELVDREDVEIVDIAVRPEDQPDIAVSAIEAGRHVLCQKPFALDLAAARRVVDAAVARGVRVAVNQQLRWDAGIAASRDLVARGALGRVVAARIEVTGGSGWDAWPWLLTVPRLEILFHSIHYLDAMRSVLGDPSWVTSIHGREPGAAARGETRTTTILEFPDGGTATVIANHDNPHGTSRGSFAFLGTDAALEGELGLSYGDPDGPVDQLRLVRDGVAVREYAFDTRWIPDAFLGPMADLMDAAATDREPMASGRDNLATLAVVEAAYRSAAARRSVRVADILAEAGLAQGQP